MTWKMRLNNGSLVLALGSNLGDRGEYVSRALLLLEECFGTASFLSQLLENEAIGFDGPAFLNCIVRYEGVYLNPFEILKICKDIEKRMGRDDKPEFDASGNRIYYSRIIDIDILFYGDRVVDTPELKIPHPGVSTRGYLQNLLSRMPE